MKYKVMGSVAPVVEFELAKGESVFTQTGAVAWQDDGITMRSEVRGGVLKGIGRMFGGESFFMVSYTVDDLASRIAFSCTVPGAIIPIEMSRNQNLIIQKGAFLCAEQSVNLDTIFTKKIASGLFGGEGFILQQLSGSGMAFLEVDGDPVEKRLGIGETIKVDTGNVVAFEDSVDYMMETVNGLGNVFFGGEPLFLIKLSGPGKVILQTLKFRDMAGKILSLAPSSRGK